MLGQFFKKCNIVVPELVCKQNRIYLSIHIYTICNNIKKVMEAQQQNTQYKRPKIINIKI